jgi:hypothetical protein
MSILVFYLNAITASIFNISKKANPFNNSLDLDQHALRLRKKLKSNSSKKVKTKRIILVEANQIPSNQLALAMALPAFSKFFDANLVAYRVGAESSIQKAKQILRHKLSIINAAGATKILILKKEKHSSMRDEFYKFGVCSKEDLENFTLDGVYLGDLIYDEYLSSTHSSTINFEDLKFQQIFQDSIKYVRLWEKIFENNKVSAICIWHDVYFYALPARVAFKYNVAAFSITTRGVYRLTPEWPHAGLNPANEVLQDAILPSNPSPQEDFAETFGQSTLSHIYKSELALPSSSLKQKRSNKIRILVANHIFFDAPHCYGNMFYPDFEAWLTKLAEIAEETDYVWFLKPHPHAPFWKENNLIELFSENNRMFRLLPIEISKEEIEKLSIDFVLTVHGTTSLHYATEGYKVINASRNNPYNKYGFSYTPDSREQYEQILRDLENFDYDFKFGEVVNYAENIAKLEIENWLFKSHNDYFDQFKTANEAMSTQSYSYFLKFDNSRKSTEIENALINFLNSEHLNLNRIHFKN